MKVILGVLIVFLIGMVSCGGPHGPSSVAPPASDTPGGAGETKLQTATFAGGCFWCTEADFEKAYGVVKVISGYTGGKGANPTYDDFAGKGYVQAVQVLYDPQKTSYQRLLDYFWRHIDPTDAGGQFIDRGVEYRSVIFYENDEQRQLAEKSKKELEQSGRFSKPIVTEIVAFTKFYPAEDYHQDYYRRHSFRYGIYRNRTGRDEFLQKIWGEGQRSGSAKVGNPQYAKPSDAELQQKLTPLQYKVTQQEGTESPFRNEYWDNKREGIYVDIVTGEPLFSSRDKYDSGTGWPSFTKPLVPGNLMEKEDRRLGPVRTEVRSKRGDSHLGHVFPDGPPSTGLRYCINSAALRFIPKEDLKKEGYGEYLSIFQNQKK